ncbi:MAG: phage tail protein, partial [Desulfuromonadales bacterium]|nr:phage tail protein [Desulfuromonadales bacterium]
MGDVGRIALGAGLIVGTIATGGALGILAGPIIGLGATVGAQGILGVLGLAPELGVSQSDLRATAVDPFAPIPVVYGRARTGLKLMDIRVDPANSSKLWMVGAICHGSRDGSGIEGVREVYIDGRLAWTDTGGVQTPFGFRTPFGDVSFISVIVRDGSTGQTTPTELTSTFAGTWTTGHRARGVAYIALELQVPDEGNLIGGSLPTVEVVVDGVRVEDPRVPGWAHSANPILCVRDYLLSSVYGGGWSEADMDDNRLMVEADHSDTLVDDGGAGTEPRYLLDGVVDTRREVGQNVAAMLTACRGRPRHQGGLWTVWIPKAGVSTGYKVDADTISGTDPWRMRRIAGGGRPNSIVARYVGLDGGTHEVRHPAPGAVNTWLTEDGGEERLSQIDLPFTASQSGAERIAMLELKGVRIADLEAAVTCDETALALEVGDIVDVTRATAGWTDKPFVVAAMAIRPDARVELALAEYDAAAHSLDPLQTTPTQPNTGLPDPYTVAQPTGLTLTSDATTVTQQTPGVQMQRIRVQWTRSVGPFLAREDVRYRRDVDATWLPAGSVPPSDADPITNAQEILTPPLEPGVLYQVQVAAVNTLGRRATTSGAITTATVPGVTALVPLAVSAGQSSPGLGVVRWEADTALSVRYNVAEG